MSPEEALARLLETALPTPEELLGFVFALPGGRRLAMELEPHLDNPLRFTYEAASALMWQDAAVLYPALRAARPDLDGQIASVAALFGAPLPPSPTRGHAPPRPLPDVRALDDALGAALADRRAARRAGADTADLDARILDLKRARQRGPTLRAGDHLDDGRYELIEEVGEGGFATVWRALDLARDDAVVAVKVLHSQYAEDRTRRERFFRGATQMARLRHPGVVRVLREHGHDAGFHYFVMDFLPGGDLRQAVLGGRLSGDDALRVVLAVGDALAHAHGAIPDLVHRDVKPHNILLDAGGRPLLTDFDLVKTGDTTGATRTGALGTLLYAAPEALEHAGRCDARADVYGLGMTALFCLKGADINRADWRDPGGQVRKAATSGAVRRVLAKAVEEEPEARYANMALFCAALRAALDTGPDPREVPGPRAFGGINDPPTDTPTGLVEVALVGVAPLRFVGLSEGEFTMGTREDVPAGETDERPAHRVRISPLFVATTPVTQAQWQAVMSVDPSHFKGADRPVESVSWHDAVQFCNTLSEREGRRPAYRVSWARQGRPIVRWRRGGDGYRLPTEAEWEYFCRAGTTTLYWCGDSETELARRAWIDHNSGLVTHAVGERRAPNPWGLHDVHGNVAEWCWDAWGPYSLDPVTDPSTDHGARRVYRGGSFGSTATAARSAYRDARDPESRSQSRGFRVVYQGRAP